MRARLLAALLSLSLILTGVTPGAVYGAETSGITAVSGNEESPEEIGATDIPIVNTETTSSGNGGEEDASEAETERTAKAEDTAGKTESTAGKTEGTAGETEGLTGETGEESSGSTSEDGGEDSEKTTEPIGPSTARSISFEAASVAIPDNMITGFRTLAEEQKNFFFEKENKPGLSELVARMPASLTVTMGAGGTVAEIPVTWQTPGMDYETSGSYYFQFSPILPSGYVLSPGLDVTRDVPYISVFLQDAEVTAVPESDPEIAASAVKIAGSGVTSANAIRIFQYLTGSMGLNTAAASGVLANIQAESSFNPYALGDGGTSYGICQWHNSRWVSLQSYCNSLGVSWQDLDGQLLYLSHELSTGYAGVLSALRSAPNTAEGAYNSAWYWCMYFEIPANKAQRSVERGNLARDYYWPVYSTGAYGGGDPDTPGGGTEIPKVELPSLKSAKVTLNALLLNPSATVQVRIPNGMELSSLTMIEEESDFSLDETTETGVYELTFSGDSQEKYVENTTVKLPLELIYLDKEGEEKTLKLTLTVAVTRKQPTVKTTLQSAANLFYRNTKAVYRIEGGDKIRSVTTEEPEKKGFVVLEPTYDEETGELLSGYDPATGILILDSVGNDGSYTAAQKKVELIMEHVDYTDVITKTLTVSTVKKTPYSLKADPVSLYGEETEFTGRILDKTLGVPFTGNGESMTVSCKSDAVEIADGTLTNGTFQGSFTATRNLTTKLVVESEDWTAGITIGFNVKPKQKLPTSLTLGASSVAMLSDGQHSVSIPLSLAGSTLPIEDVEVTGGNKKTAEALTDIHASYDPESASLILTGDEELAAGSYKLKLQPSAIIDGDTMRLKKTAALTVKALPAMTAKVKASGSLKVSAPETSLMKLTVTVKDFKGVQIRNVTTDTPGFLVRKQGGLFYLILDSENLPDPGKQEVRFTVTLKPVSGEEITAEAVQKLTVGK